MFAFRYWWSLRGRVLHGARAWAVWAVASFGTAAAVPIVEYWQADDAKRRGLDLGDQIAASAIVFTVLIAARLLWVWFSAPARRDEEQRRRIATLEAEAPAFEQPQIEWGVPTTDEIVDERNERLVVGLRVLVPFTNRGAKARFSAQGAWIDRGTGEPGVYPSPHWVARWTEDRGPDVELGHGAVGTIDLAALYPSQGPEGWIVRPLRAGTGGSLVPHGSHKAASESVLMLSVTGAEDAPATTLISFDLTADGRPRPIRIDTSRGSNLTLATSGSSPKSPPAGRA